MTRKRQQGTDGEKHRPQRRDVSLQRGEIQRDQHQEDERRRLSGESEKARSSSAADGVTADDHSAMPSPGDIGAPDYYAGTPRPEVARPAARRPETVEEEEED